MEPKLDWLLRWRKQAKEPCPFPYNEYVIVQDVTLTPDVITRAVCNLNKGDYWRPLNLNHYVCNDQDDECLILPVPSTRKFTGKIIKKIQAPPLKIKESEVEKYSPENIVEILHSIKKLQIDEFGELDVWFDDSKYPETSTGFIPGSFTRELLELIEEHLFKESVANHVLNGLGVVRMLVRCRTVPDCLKSYKRSASIDSEWLAFLVPEENVSELKNQLSGICVSVGAPVYFERTSTNQKDY